MSFFLSHGWVCGFLEEDLKTSAGRRRTFATSEKVRELIQRTETKMDLAARQALDHAIEKGRGGVFLNLTDEQYTKLKR